MVHMTEQRLNFHSLTWDSLCCQYAENLLILTKASKIDSWVINPNRYKCKCNRYIQSILFALTKNYMDVVPFWELCHSFGKQSSMKINFSSLYIYMYSISNKGTSSWKGRENLEKSGNIAQPWKIRKFLYGNLKYVLLVYPVQWLIDTTLLALPGENYPVQWVFQC